VVRVLIAEDMRIVSDTLAAVLNPEDDIDAIGPAAVAQRPASRWSILTCLAPTG
jgi:hypothetical protein